MDLRKDDRKRCRICCRGNRSTEMMSPCLCKGSLAFVHYQCLIDWILVSKSDECNVCLGEYNCIRLVRALPSFPMYVHTVYKDIGLQTIICLFTLNLLVLSLITYIAYFLLPDIGYTEKLILILKIVSVFTALAFYHIFSLALEDYRHWQRHNSVIQIETKLPALNPKSRQKYKPIKENKYFEL